MSDDCRVHGVNGRYLTEMVNGIPTPVWHPVEPGEAFDFFERSSVRRQNDGTVFVGYSRRLQFQRMSGGSVTTDELRDVRSWINRMLHEDTAADWQPGPDLPSGEEDEL